jgi:hypothetical protein
VIIIDGNEKKGLQPSMMFTTTQGGVAQWTTSKSRSPSPFGEVRHRLAQVRERTTGTVVFPLVEKLRMEPYRRYQGATLEAPVGQAVHLSYRLAAKETQRIRGQGPSKSTIWRRLQELAEAQGGWPSSKH